MDYPDWETVEGVVWWRSGCIHWWVLWLKFRRDWRITKNATSFKNIFEIVPSRADGNCLFHTWNNLVFRGTL